MQNPVVHIKTDFTKSENLMQYTHVRERDSTVAFLRKKYGESARVLRDSTYFFIVPEEVYQKAVQVLEDKRGSVGADKMCAVCKQVKPVAEFYKSEYGGYLNQCKACFNAARAGKYANNKQGGSK